MKALVVLCALLSIVSFVRASDVVVLTDANFDELTKNGEWLLEFYAPWCGHCKKLAPTYEEVATTLKGKINVGKVDCTVEKETASRFGIRGYPTLKFASGGQIYDYKGERTTTALATFAEGGYKSATANPIPPRTATPPPAAPAQASPAADGPSDVVVLTDANFDEQTKNGNWLLEFYAPWCGHCKKLAPTYEQLATKLKGKINVGKVDCTVEKEVAGRFGIRGYPTLKFSSGGKVYDYKGERTVDALSAFAEGGYQSAATVNPFPTKGAAKPQPAAAAAETAGNGDLVVLTDADFDSKTSSGRWLIKFYAPWCGHCKKLAPTFEKLATTVKGQVNVAKVDCTVHKNICNRFGVMGYPTVYLQQDGQIYEYNGDRSENDFVTFLNGGYKSAQASPAPAPGSNRRGEKGGNKNDLSNIIAQAEKLVKEKVWVALGVMFILGVLLGKVVLGSSAEQAKPKTN